VQALVQAQASAQVLVQALVHPSAAFAVVQMEEAMCAGQFLRNRASSSYILQMNLQLLDTSSAPILRVCELVQNHPRLGHLD
jgi:hypothetical protein